MDTENKDKHQEGKQMKADNEHEQSKSVHEPPTDLPIQNNQKPVRQRISLTKIKRVARLIHCESGSLDLTDLEMLNAKFEEAMNLNTLGTVSQKKRKARAKHVTQTEKKPKHVEATKTDEIAGVNPNNQMTGDLKSKVDTDSKLDEGISNYQGSTVITGIISD